MASPFGKLAESLVRIFDFRMTCLAESFLTWVAA